ncbi:MAG: hypothetical protein R3B84_11335 [Zavarzinella sp.]
MKRIDTTIEENLLGHVMGLNDPATDAQVEQWLKKQPDTTRILNSLQTLLLPLDVLKDDSEPPSSLYFSTLGQVAKYMVDHPHMEPVALPASSVDTVIKQQTPPPDVPLYHSEDITDDDEPVEIEYESTIPTEAAIVLPGDELEVSGSTRTIFGWLIAACFLLIGVGIVVPLIGRFQSNREIARCQNSLQQMYQGLTTYSSQNNKGLPTVPEGQPVRTVLDDLLASSIFTSETLPRCSSNASTSSFGGYTYSLGYRDDSGQLQLHPEAADLSSYPLMSDAPKREQTVITPINHSTGSNVLFAAGNVRLCRSVYVGVNADDIFHNLQQKVHAGISSWDSVLGSCEDRP